MAQQDYEAIKIFNDYIKHLNTLSTGSILLLVTFLEKLFQHPSGKWLIIISLISFLISIIGGVLLKTIFSSNALSGADEDAITNGEVAARGIGALMLWSGFLIGIISFGIFGIVNLL